MSHPAVPTSGASQQDTDKQMVENAEIREIYRHEMNRLTSFKEWKRMDSAAPTMLAKAGFFYTAQGDTVECFVCRVRINQWKMSDDPMKEHKINSPGCIFVNVGDSGNVPLRPGEQKETPETARKMKQVDPKPEPMDAGKGLNEATAKLDREIKERMEALSRKYPHSIEFEHTSEKLQDIVGVHQKSPDEEMPALNLSIGQTGSLLRSHSHPPDILFHERSREEQQQQSAVTFGTTIFSTPGDAVPYGDQVRALTIAQIKTELRSGPPFSGATERCSIDDLLPLVDNASSPEYASIKKRMDSFSGWRQSNKADPKKLAEAGFYYTGTDDRVRCFQCNGGLCNWQNEDIPWYEHYRWFGKCPYLLKAAKNEVVKVTISTAKHIHGAREAEQRRHHHHHGSGRTQCDPVLVAQDIWQTDNMKRLMSMGFTRNRIQTVIDRTSPQIVNDIEKMIDILDKPAPASPARHAAAPASPSRAPPASPARHAIVLSSPSRSRIVHREAERNQGEELISAHLCQVCRQSKVSLMFLPCRHLVACMDCGIHLDLCPFCKKKVQATSKVEVK